MNRDAASSMKGIVAFRNSENAMHRWSPTMTQKGMTVTELRSFPGLEVGENATAQCQSSQIKRDNRMSELSAKTDCARYHQHCLCLAQQSIILTGDILSVNDVRCG